MTVSVLFRETYKNDSGIFNSSWQCVQ